MKIFSSTKIIALCVIGLISACSDNNNDNTTQAMAKYQIKVYNLTANQPLTPVAVITHESGFKAWQLGMSASTGLEKLAESGDNSDFLNTSKTDTMVMATASGSGAITPGNSETISISSIEKNDLQISIASMLANTNDAFTGVANWDVGSLAVNESTMMLTRVFDAGTEKNTEMAGTIPGPADGGTGYDATRDDLVDKVLISPGVVTSDDGLSTSVLNESHRWLEYAAKVVITRIE